MSLIEADRVAKLVTQVVGEKVTHPAVRGVVVQLAKGRLTEHADEILVRRVVDEVLATTAVKGLLAAPLAPAAGEMAPNLRVRSQRI